LKSLLPAGKFESYDSRAAFSLFSVRLRGKLAVPHIEEQTSTWKADVSQSLNVVQEEGKSNLRIRRIRKGKKQVRHEEFFSPLGIPFSLFPLFDYSPQSHNLADRTW
jgi:hypothetical protein